MNCFIHAADLHLDSPLLGLEQYDSAPVEEARQATRHAFRKLIDLCLERRAPLLLLAGDVFDSNWHDFNTGLFYIHELSRLREAGTRVITVRGNHDSASEVTRSLTLPEHVTELSSRTVASVEVAELGLVVHGRSYTQRAVTENWVPDYPDPVDGMINVGLLHTNVDGSPDHDNYAPCRLSDLVDKGYDYWALGHIHERRVLNESPYVVYPGCLQGRHVRESGPKGCMVVDLADGAITGVEPVDLQAMQWTRLEVVLGGDEEDADAVLEVVAERFGELSERESELLAVRVEVSGACRGYMSVERERERLVNEVRALPGRTGARAWIEKVRLRVRPPLETSHEGAAADLREQLRERVAALEGDADGLAQLAEVLQPMVKKAGSEVEEAPAGAAWLQDLLPEVQAVLDVRLKAADE